MSGDVPFSGVGTVFKRAGVAVAEINSIDGPNKSRATIDVTSLDSTGGYREFIAGIRDAGQVTLNMNFTRAGYDDLNDDFESDSNVAYQIVLPDSNNTQFGFNGLVVDLGVGITFDDKVTATATIKIDSEVTISS